MSWYLAIRWIHIIAATAWVGEVFTINFVLVPAMGKLSREERGRVMLEVFPRIFRLASWLSGTAVLAGIYLFYQRFSGGWGELLSTFSGRAFLIGATLGTALTAFHFILEPRLEGAICVAAEEPEGEQADQVMATLRVVPRVGMAVITLALLLMMIGARGI